MHLCIVVPAVWLIGCLLVALVDLSAIRRYRWRLVLVLLLTLPYVIYRVSVAIWMKTC
jgi:hypothetical protein